MLRTGARGTTSSPNWSSQQQWRAPCADRTLCTNTCVNTLFGVHWMKRVTGFISSLLQVSELHFCEPQLKLLHTCYTRGGLGVRGALQRLTCADCLIRA